MKQANTHSKAVSHHRDGGFRNPWPGSVQHGAGGLLKWMAQRAIGQRVSASPDALGWPALFSSIRKPEKKVGPLTVTWIGHSSFLIQCCGTNVLIDPVWSDRASPISIAGPHRLVPPGISFEDLPSIDVTLVSHDHYDHLDDATVRRLVHRFPDMKWVAPLRAGEFIRSRGARSVTELDWWDMHDMASIRISSTPAQHFSGRYPWNRNATLWCGWTMRFEDGSNVFYAGDTGLHPEFGEITRRLGPFDLAILPIGAYEPRWFMRPVHMSPEESVVAYSQLVSGISAVDGGMCVMVGCHWGTFRLTEEPVMEPPLRCQEAFSAAGFNRDDLWILAHGETRTINHRR